jgi:uncharacterized protein YecE (DUF72 family)
MAIRIGTCSWTDESLLASGWYPEDAKDAASRLRYYASRFDLVENDSAYYALPTAKQAEAWVARTPEGFTMNVKAYAPLTMHYTDPKRFPKDLKGGLAPALLGKRRAYPRDLGEDLMEEISARFRSALEPLRRAGKLGAILFQFAPWFVTSPESSAWIRHLRESFEEDRIAIEFRNPSWVSEKNLDRTMSMLRELDIAHVVVDAPVGARFALPSITEVTSDLAIVRFLGRDKKRFEKKTDAARDRFRYLYAERELEDWVPAIERMAREAEEVHVLMNNCFGADAVINAAQLKRMIGSPRSTATPEDEAAYR